MLRERGRLGDAVVEVLASQGDRSVAGEVRRADVRAEQDAAAALSDPFHARWAFDVELIGRLLQGDPPLRPADFVEIPLQRWTDVSGSKIGPLQMVRTAWDLVVIAVRYHARKRVP